MPPIPPPRRNVYIEHHRSWHFAPDLKRFVASVLDAVDTIADIVATELKLRPESRRPPTSDPPTG